MSTFYIDNLYTLLHDSLILFVFFYYKSMLLGVYLLNDADNKVLF